MYGIRRGLAMLAGTSAAGVLVWRAARTDPTTTAGYWTANGVLACAGLVLLAVVALGTGPVRGLPRLSPARVAGLLPALVVMVWILLAAEPERTWFGGHVTTWSASLGIGTLVAQLAGYAHVLAFASGLTTGLSFDRGAPSRARDTVATGPRPADAPPVAGHPDIGPPSFGTDRSQVA